MENKKRQMIRLEELEQILWDKIQEGQVDNRTIKLYSDVAFKVLRHHAIYDNREAKEEDGCILDNLFNDAND
jgi:hypothetical protein